MTGVLGGATYNDRRVISNMTLALLDDTVIISCQK